MDLTKCLKARLEHPKKSGCGAATEKWRRVLSTVGVRAPVDSTTNGMNDATLLLPSSESSRCLYLETL